MSQRCSGRNREYSLERVDRSPVPVGDGAREGSDGSLIRSPASEIDSIVQGPLHVLVVLEEALPRLHDLVNFWSLRGVLVPAHLDETPHRDRETKIPGVLGKFRPVPFQYTTHNLWFMISFE